MRLKDALETVWSGVMLFFFVLFLLPVVLPIMVFWFGGTSRNKCGDCGAKNSYKSSTCWHCEAPLRPNYNM